ncbi:MAG: hypothetical protein IPN32_29070 [Deltaproteobacteria bacterium]|nr:hypothetical protein [Deltaproteobacteria bacterium]
MWVQDEPPDGVPDEVYCLECIEVPCDTPHAITGADGSFSLSAVAGSQWLVVSKGQFMRATPIELAAGGQAAASESTRLPNRRAPDEGQWMPNIALAWGDYDALQDALAKLGLGELDGSSQHLAPGTEAFDVWDNHADNFGSTPQNPITTMSMGTLEALVSDADALSKYHIVFVPCASGNAAFTPAQLDNIRAWVAAGGKWYVADWSLAWLDEPFGQYQTFLARRLVGRSLPPTPSTPTAPCSTMPCSRGSTRYRPRSPTSTRSIPVVATPRSASCPTCRSRICGRRSRAHRRCWSTMAKAT